jgi:hypothetical protein
MPGPVIAQERTYDFALPSQDFQTSLAAALGFPASEGYRLHPQASDVGP